MRGLARPTALAATASLCATVLAACGPVVPRIAPGVVAVVAAESVYGDVAAQVGGAYVHVTSILSSPSADPHSFEASPSVAATIAKARLIVQNGAGYDAFMSQIEGANPDAGRRVIVAQRVLGLASPRNPHLWYSPTTMVRVADAIATALSGLAPSHAEYFTARLRDFVRSLAPWHAQIARFRAMHPRATAAVTEPVADYLLNALGVQIVTPWSFQLDVMNGSDPTPQDVSAISAALRAGSVDVLCVNAQVVDSLTSSMRATAEASQVPVVAVYETEPLGLSYQQWMEDETAAITRAVALGTSTPALA